MITGEIKFGDFVVRKGSHGYRRCVRVKFFDPETKQVELGDHMASFWITEEYFRDAWSRDRNEDPESAWIPIAPETLPGEDVKSIFITED